MATIPVRFTYYTGLTRDVLHNAHLVGSWDAEGRYSHQWSAVPMQSTIAEDGCPGFTAIVPLDESQVGQVFRWGVILDSPSANSVWGITTEVQDHHSQDRDRRFILQPPHDNTPQQETYYLTHCRRLGAQKYFPMGQPTPAIRFAVWAPYANSVEVVFGTTDSGYIADDGFGIDDAIGPFPMFRTEDGIWQTNLTISPELADFSRFDHKPYMFRVVKEDGQIAYRTDLYSRCQIGQGNFNPNGHPFTGKYVELDGTKSCSVVVNPETVTQQFQEVTFPELEFINQDEFWRDEFVSDRPVPNRIEDLIIYELHLGALGYGRDRPGNFQDAIELIPYLVELGINAIELLPPSEFRDTANWGYETSHYFALEFSAGGRDQFKHLIRACHRAGIAVLLDVVYNHYNPDGERAEWAYDSNQPEHNIYYWYEGESNQYPQPDGGYLDNWSTGFAPRFHSEMVRKMFISSAVTLMEEFHLDGFRVDQTTSMHLYNALHADGRAIATANQFGAKFLREYTRTLKLINPNIILIAEDHSNWDQVTESPDAGGLGFDATWYADFYHHLIGETRQGSEYAKLIPTAGDGTNEPLAMDFFAGALAASGNHKVVYHESHDEAGNSYYEDHENRIESRRTIATAVNNAPLIGETRRVAEARCRFAAGMAMLSAGTPMFLMGEEIGAQKPYRYADFLQNREDLWGEKTTHGARLFRFYQDLIQLRKSYSGLRSHNIEIIHVHNANRVLAFRRWDEQSEFLIIASLNNNPFTAGYLIHHPAIGDRVWKEIFNSDAKPYGGYDIGNYGTAHTPVSSSLAIVLPSNGLVVFQRI